MKPKRVVDCESATIEPEGVEDYIEAEINSTDTLIPKLTELFGEDLLRKGFSSDCLGVESGVEVQGQAVARGGFKLEDVLESGDVPGEVRLRATTAARDVASVNATKRYNNQRVFPVTSASFPKGLTANNFHTGSQRQLHGLKDGGTGTSGNKATHIGAKNFMHVHFEESARTTSMMSHATFVLENNPRRPLLAGRERFSHALAAFNIAPMKPALDNASGTSAQPEVLVLEGENKGATARGDASIATGVKRNSHLTSAATRRATPTVRSRDSSLIPRQTSQIASASQTTSLVGNNQVRAHSLTGIGRSEEGEDLKNGDKSLDYMTVFGAKPRIARTPLAD